MHAWFPPLHESQSHDKGTFAKHNTVRMHTSVHSNADTSTLSNREAPHLVRRVDVGLGLEQHRDNSFLARP